MFESKIRPVLAAKCFSCHSVKLKAPMGGLVLDTKSGMAVGGANGVVIVAGKPMESRLLSALRFTDPHLQMPPTGKLPDAAIADFEEWITTGAPDPRTSAPVGEKQRH
ncbi:MAG: c-type cytochrome domain-containing protein [Bryobacteraceae bacterium]